MLYLGVHVLKMRDCALGTAFRSISSISSRLQSPPWAYSAHRESNPHPWVASHESVSAPSLGLQLLPWVVALPTSGCPAAGQRQSPPSVFSVCRVSWDPLASVCCLLLKLCGEMAQCLKCNPEPRVQISRTHISLDTLVHVSVISVLLQGDRRQRYEESTNLRASTPGDGNKTKTLFQTKGKVEYWGIKLSSELLVCLWTYTGAHTC